MICQVCNEHEAAFERGSEAHTLRICYSCLSRTGMHLLAGWRLLPVGRPPEDCPDCGLSWTAFAADGRYGCPSCRAAFASAFEELILAGSPMAGRQVEQAPPFETGFLPEELDLGMALLLEDYELAARIRDHLDTESSTWKS